jgi:hypothetical protein
MPPLGASDAPGTWYPMAAQTTRRPPRYASVVTAASAEKPRCHHLGCMPFLAARGRLGVPGPRWPPLQRSNGSDYELSAPPGVRPEPHGDAARKP